MRGILQAVLMMTEENLLNKQEFLVHDQHFFYSHDCDWFSSNILRWI